MRNKGTRPLDLMNAEKVSVSRCGVLAPTWPASGQVFHDRITHQPAHDQRWQAAPLPPVRSAVALADRGFGSVARYAATWSALTAMRRSSMIGNCPPR